MVPITQRKAYPSRIIESQNGLWSQSPFCPNLCCTNPCPNPAGCTPLHQAAPSSLALSPSKIGHPHCSEQPDGCFRWLWNLWGFITFWKFITFLLWVMGTLSEQKAMAPKPQLMTENPTNNYTICKTEGCSWLWHSFISRMNTSPFTRKSFRHIRMGLYPANTFNYSAGRVGSGPKLKYITFCGSSYLILYDIL